MAGIGVGLMVLTAPLHQAFWRFKGLLPFVAQHVNRLLYVQLAPGCNTWPPKDRLLNGGKSQNYNVAACAHLVSRIYGHCTTYPDLDVRILLSGLQTPLNEEELGLVTSKKIEAVFFDTDASTELTKDFMDKCFTDARPKHIKLRPSRDDSSENSKSAAIVDEVDFSKIVAGKTDKVYDNVALGGTFDRIHCGHKILLSNSLIRCRKTITVGVSDGDDLLGKKVLKELIMPCTQRVKDVKEFLKDCSPNLEEYNVISILDPFGPSTVNSSLELIVGSAETEGGCQKVNQIRSEKGLSQLDIHLIPIVKDPTNNSEYDLPVVDPEVVSSSLRRMRLLGSELQPPTRQWDEVSGPYVIGLTGGSASGKSSIASYLASLGAFVINCDSMAHKAYSAGTPGFDEIVKEFGNGIVGEDGEINRVELGKRVFGKDNEQNLRKLESIVWPETMKLVLKEIASANGQGKKVVVLDAAVLLNAGWDEHVHQVWVAITDRDEAVKRIVDRDGKSEEEAVRRLDSQLPNKEIIGRANVVFCTNWEKAFTRKQVDKAWNCLNKSYIQKYRAKPQ